MTVRGEFVRGDGLVLPNNVTPFGKRAILVGAFQNQPIQFIVGLGDAVYRPDILESEINEPVVAGYSRVLIPRDLAGWPVITDLNGETYVESAPIYFAAFTTTGYTFSRLILLDQGVGVPANVLAMSAAAPAPMRIVDTTPEPERTFKYRLYLG